MTAATSTSARTDEVDRSRQALWAALVLILVWGANFSVQKAVFQALSPGGFLFVRYLIMPVAAAMLLCFRFGLRWPRLARADEIPAECGVLVASERGLEVARPAPKRPTRIGFALWMALARATPVDGWRLDDAQMPLGADDGDAGRAPAGLATPVEGAAERGSPAAPA